MSLTGATFLLFLFAATTFAIDDRLRSDWFNIYKHAAIETRNITRQPVTPDKVTFYLYSNISDQYLQLTEDNLNVLNNKKIVFLIHGWINSKEVKWYADLRRAFQATYKDYYVVEVDWKEPAWQFYYVSSINTYDVGKIIAELIKDLYENHNVTLSDVLLIGHSLGGQITGFVGKNFYKLTGEKLHRIIALDPAGPLFTQRPEDKRLNQDDADIVEVIHSDGGTFGYKDAIGTIDFFPNGGSSQPGCKIINLLDVTNIIGPIPCDHFRAGEYFIEAIQNPDEFVAKQCVDWDSYKRGECENQEVALGDLTTEAKGKFYLETNPNKPFGKSKSKSNGFGNLLNFVL